MKSTLLFFLLICTPLLAKAQAGDSIKSARADTTVYTWAETMPSFSGGDTAFWAFINKNFQNTVLDSNAQPCTVYISYIVEKDGSLSQITLLKSGTRSDAVAQEVLRIFSIMPKWEPGISKGEKVRVRVVQRLIIDIG